MNCQEVMEYMQRQLDGDLDEREAEILMTHTRHCQDCATMLDRLQLLSVGLESLPKVTPSYSLVDAIMPRLMELQPESSESAITEEPLVKRAERAGRFSGWKNRFTVRTIGGVIAAAVVAGLFLVTYKPGDMNNLDESASQLMIADTAAESRSGANTSADMAPTDNEAAADRKVEVESVPRMGIVEQSDNRQQEASKTAIDKDSVEPLKNKAEESLPETEKSQSKVQSPNYEKTITGGSAADNYFVADQSGVSLGANPLPDNPVIGNSISGNVNDGAAYGSKGIVAEGAGASGMKQSPQYSVEQTVSPDGAYKVVIVNDQLQIYLIADSTLLFESVKRAGGFIGLQWSDDSKALTYETAADDGKLAKFIIDPKNGTEQKQP